MLIHQQNAVEVKAWKARWEEVNRFEIEELRRTPVELKLQQLASLMFSAMPSRPDRKQADENDRVRSRWMTLRQAYGV